MSDKRLLHRRLSQAGDVETCVEYVDEFPQIETDDELTRARFLCVRKLMNQLNQRRSLVIFICIIVFCVIPFTRGVVVGIAKTNTSYVSWESILLYINLQASKLCPKPSDGTGEGRPCIVWYDILATEW